MFPLAGELFAFCSALIWAVSMSLFTRHGRGQPAGVLNLYKGIISSTCLLLSLLFVPSEGLAPLDSSLLLVLSGFIGICLGDTALFAALRRLGAQVTSASQCLAPPLCALLALIFLGETLTRVEVLGIGITVFAIAWLLLSSRRAGAQLASHSTRDVWIGIGFAAISALCQATGVVLARKALAHSPVFWGAALRIVPATIALWISNEIRGDRPKLIELWRDRPRARGLALASFGGTFLAIVFLTAATKYTKAGIAVAISSTYPVWILPIAAVYLKERVTWRSAAGAALAVCGILLLVLGKSYR